MLHARIHGCFDVFRIPSGDIGENPGYVRASSPPDSRRFGSPGRPPTLNPDPHPNVDSHSTALLSSMTPPATPASDLAALLEAAVELAPM